MCDQVPKTRPSESRPIPILRHTGPKTLPQPHVPLPKHTPHTRSLPSTAYRRRRRLIPVRALTVTPAAPCNLPGSEIPPAVLACPRPCAFGMIVGVLVEGNGVEGVRVAEDVAAASTVMAAGEVSEVALASCFVADGGLGIGLQDES